MGTTRVAPQVIANPYSMPPVKPRQEEEQPKTALYTPEPLLQPTSVDGAKAAAKGELTGAVSAVEGITKSLGAGQVVNPAELDRVAEQLDQAQAAVDSAALQGDSRLHAEHQRDDWRAGVSHDIGRAREQLDQTHDPLQRTFNASLEMAAAIGHTTNAHSAEIVDKSQKIKQLNELKGLLQVHAGKDEVDFNEATTAQELKDFNRIRELLPVARECGVIWPEEECGWKKAESRSARLEGIDRAREELTKDNEIKNLKLQQLSQFYYIHMMNAIAALKMLADIIKQVIQRISHG